MDNWLQLVLASVTSILACSGFWAWVQRRTESKSATTRLMMGIAYEHITTFGIAYIDRGWITKDEYEEIDKYFYKPYKELGGNGVAERVMNEVARLPITPHNKYAGIFTNRDRERYINDVNVIPNRHQATPE